LSWEIMQILFEDTKGVTINRKSKDRQYNGQTKTTQIANI